MGLIKAGLGAVGSVLADQWKEFFYCDSIDKDILVVKGQKRTGKNSSNTKGSDNVITNGSGIAVADGQCMIIVEQGKVVEVCAEPGEFTYDTSLAPSIFTGSLGTSIKETFKQIGKRFTYGGDTGVDQRVYYFNIKEIMDNKFGTANPIIFRVVDHNIGLDLDASVRCNGVYSYRICDPLLFYTNVCANVTQSYSRSEIDGQLKTEFVSALQPAFGKLSELELRPSAIPAHVGDLCDAMNEQLSKKWKELRGLEIVSIAMNPVTIPEEDQEMIKQAQREAQQAKLLSNPGMAGGALVGAQAQAMKDAANNTAGAMTGFMGMGMAGGMMGGGMNAANLFAMNQQQPQQPQYQQPQYQQPAPAPAPTPAPAGNPADAWTCPDCGAVNTGRFCMECGKSKPVDDGSWTCPDCGTLNKGKFCMNCGKKKPEAPAKPKCLSCGWEPEDGAPAPKFCPECGTPFNK